MRRIYGYVSVPVCICVRVRSGDRTDVGGSLSKRIYGLISINVLQKKMTLIRIFNSESTM